MIKLFRDQNDYVLQNSQRTIRIGDFSINHLFQLESPADFLNQILESSSSDLDLNHAEAQVDFADHAWLPPIDRQEVWAAGVTYFRSRSARMEESEQSGGDHFYNLVYEAERPELFFKATGDRTRGHLSKVCIRSDSAWDVPEPELTLALNSAGKIFGFTIGNDMSSRSIEGENPLYLPQAKVYRGSCAIGPCLVIGNPITPDSQIAITIHRSEEEVFSGSTTVSQIKRSFEELAEFLFRENEFPFGTYLMTGTGVVPDTDFTLQSGDQIQISIDGIGKLSNVVE